MEIPVEVGLERSIEMLFRQVLEFLHVLLKRCIVNEDVQLAERFDCFCNGGLAEFWVRDVARDCQAASSFSFHRLLRRLSILRLVEEGNDDIRAFSCVEHRNGASDSRITPCNESDQIKEFA